MTKVYIVQMRGPEWETIKKVFSDEGDAVSYCKKMNSKAPDNMFESLSSYQYVVMDVI